MTAFSTPNSRWAALQSRNPLATSAFIYSVITTKIYCRPTCPSRLARRANVIFHDTPAEAEAAGFRACKRCRPNLRENEGDPQILAVEKACGLLAGEEKGGARWSVKGLAKEVGLTESHFCRVFKKLTGMTIGDYRSRTNDGTWDSSVRESIVVGGQQAQHSGTPNTTSEQMPESVFASDKLSIPDLCPSQFMQDWHNFSGLHTLEGYLPDFSDPTLTNLYNCDLGFADATDILDDCSQFVDFNSPWMVGFDQEEVV